MNIYVPTHLRGLAIVDQMIKMILLYNNLIRKEVDSSEGINMKKGVDPVKGFISSCVVNDFEDDQDITEVINYLTNLFYSVKGTKKVIDYMIKYLGFKEGEIIYNNNQIDVFSSNRFLSDDTAYHESLMGFLSELLYFEDIRTNYSPSVLYINHSATTKVLASNDVVTYNEITINIDGEE